jgi:dihydroorotate dehydrogenase
MLNSETWLEDTPDNFFKELKQLEKRDVPLAVSIGYSPEDVKYLGRRLQEEIKPEIIEFSTHYSGSDITPLIEVAEALKNCVSVPVWMKISPGFPLLEELVKAASPIVDGFVAVNSLGPALDFNPVTCKPSLGSEWGQGWLSGPPILPIALAVVYRLSGITEKPIIGVGGITTGEDAVKFLMAGASLVQVCTAALKEGPSAYGRIALEINDWMEQNSYNTIEQIKGKYRKNF